MLARYLVFLALGILVTACGGESQPAVIVIPSETNTPIIHTATATHTPVPTVEVVPTITLAPTVDSAAAPTDGPTPTSVLQPTFTPEPATQTATFAPTRSGLEIEYFITSNDTSDPAPGESVLLFWKINGTNEGRIYRVDDEGNRTDFWDIDGEGRLRVDIEQTTTNEAQFVLVAELNGSVAEETLSLPIVGCSLIWFFQPPVEDCPAAPPTQSLQVEQRFEGGIMLWLESSQEIYALFSDGQTPTWQIFPDNFTDGIPIQDDSITAPPERLQPVRGFGLVWRENPAVRERLGWAVEPELGYDGVIQRADAAEQGTIYLRIRDGGIVGLQPGGVAWEVLPVVSITDLSTVPEPKSTPTAEN